MLQDLSILAHGWGIHHLSGQAVLVSHCPHSEDLRPYISPKSPLFQSKAIKKWLYSRESITHTSPPPAPRFSPTARSSSTSTEQILCFPRSSPPCCLEGILVSFSPPARSPFPGLSGEDHCCLSKAVRTPQRAIVTRGTSAQARKNQIMLNQELSTAAALPAGQGIFWQQSFCVRSSSALPEILFAVNTMFLLGFSPRLRNTGKTMRWSYLQSRSKHSSSPSEHRDSPPTGSENNCFCETIATGLRCVLSGGESMWKGCTTTSTLTDKVHTPRVLR